MFTSYATANGSIVESYVPDDEAAGVLLKDTGYREIQRAGALAQHVGR